MTDQELSWKRLEGKSLLKTRIFEVVSHKEESGTGLTGEYLSIQAGNWVMTLPVDGDDFIMVRQYRHASQTITTEFPGGMGEDCEDVAAGAARELEEETGYRPGKMTHLGSFSPNPAIMSNTVHYFLAEDLENTHVQHLDADESLNVVRVPIQEVIDKLGTGEFNNALLGTAMAMYMKYSCKK